MCPTEDQQHETQSHAVLFRIYCCSISYFETLLFGIKPCKSFSNKNIFLLNLNHIYIYIYIKRQREREREREMMMMMRRRIMM